MDLKTFISTSLNQIIEGILTAQGGLSGAKVAAEAFSVPPGHNLFSLGTEGVFTVVDFDVSVFAETKEGGGTLQVSGLESSDSSSTTSQNASRVKFAVHVKLPSGEKRARSPDYHGSRYGDLGDQD